MFSSRKNKSLISFLRDRELQTKFDSNSLTISAIKQLLRSRTQDTFLKSDRPEEDLIFSKFYLEASKRPILYDSGYLFFSDFSAYRPLYGECSNLPPRFNFEKSSAKKRVSDAISYTQPVYKNDNLCICGFQRCICLSPYLLTITEDNWLCQHLIDKGKLIKQVYANRIDEKFRFKYIDWIVYGERIVLTSTLNPGRPSTATKKSDVVVNIAIFTTFPLEFSALIEVKRSVFGEECNHVNVSDQLLIIGVGCSEVRIYSFDEFLREGDLTPYKIGDQYKDIGKVGSYPTGLPLNFTNSKVPTLLYTVNCRYQEIHFGGYPYHALTKCLQKPNFSLVNLSSDTPARLNLHKNCGSVEFSSEDSLEFHQDHSNRLVFKSDMYVEFFKLSSQNGCSSISKLFTLGFLDSKKPGATYTTSSGRIVKRITKSYNSPSVLSVDYDYIFNVYVILGVFPNNPTEGFFRFYDNISGEEIRTIKSKIDISETSFYSMNFDMGNIIVLERAMPLSYFVHVYNF